jgi:hypothetical protein
MSAPDRYQDGSMSVRVRSVKEAQLRLSQELRAAGKTWAEVASVFRREYNVNARVALRIARGWSQNDAAEKWNERWPDDLKTFKNFSYWERWPSATGYAPSLDVLSRLAELYSCHVSDLLVDSADHRHLDPVYTSRRELHRLPAAIAASYAGDTSTDDETNPSHDLAAFVARLHDGDVNELAQAAAGWAQHLDPTMDRRALLLKLSFALTLAASTPDVLPSISVPDPASAGATPELGGIWRSEYSYYSSGRQQQFSDVHYVVVRQNGHALTVESLRHSTGSQVALSLALDGLFATGTWEERTSPTGYYKGAIYRGAIQLLVAPSLTQMTGKWLGFGKNFGINTGDWQLTLESRTTSAAELRKYHLKA